MLTLKELNDRTYHQILDKSKELIPRIFPEWTDLRAHDPGITFVELFAWLVEMLEEYLNNVTIKNHMKFLKLLNVTPREPERAIASVTFESSPYKVVIPQGTKLIGEGIVFETCATISLNDSQRVDAIHGNTHSKVYYFNGTDKKFSIEMDGYLPYFGECEVKVKKGRYWYSWKEISRGKCGCGDEIYKVKRDKSSMKTTIVFGKEVKKKANQNTPNIMVIAYAKEFREKREIEFKRALPNQVLRLNWDVKEEIIYPGNFKMQVGEWLYGKNTYRWRDYERVEDFLNSKGNDPHLVIDFKKREIQLGNNERGALPKGFWGNKIQVVSCTCGCGSKGNIRENIISKVDDNICEKNKVNIINQSPASGGRDGEGFEEALKNLLLDMKKQYRAVTCEDYENAVLTTPGIKVVRAKALPEFVKGLKNYPYKRAHGQMTVVAVPGSMEKKPLADSEFIERIEEHLEKMRLVTTKVHVITPVYIGIQVKCTIVTVPHIKFDEKSVYKMLEEFISPIGGKTFSGWAFGERVRKGDIISKISALDGVEYVKDMALYAKGEDIMQDKSGDIIIPPYALVYSDKHQIIIARD